MVFILRESLVRMISSGGCVVNTAPCNPRITPAASAFVQRTYLSELYRNELGRLLYRPVWEDVCMLDAQSCCRDRVVVGFVIEV